MRQKLAYPVRQNVGIPIRQDIDLTVLRKKCIASFRHLATIINGYTTLLCKQLQFIKKNKL